MEQNLELSLKTIVTTVSEKVVVENPETLNQIPEVADVLDEIIVELVQS